MKTLPILPAFLLAIVGAPADADVPAKLDGAWQGTLSVNGGIKLRLVLRVSRDKDGPLRATLDSPDQGATGLKVDSIAVDKGVVRLAMTGLGAEFTGKLNGAGTEADGNWTQRGATLPLVLKKTDAPAERPRRPQEPRPPLPYTEEQVHYENQAGGVKLAGTLTVPPGKGPFSAVLLISGSGAQDRDETIFGHKPFLVLADTLTRRGIAVLRVDDRGVGGSTGNLSTSTSEDLAGDALCGVAFLKARKEIDPKKIGLLGHSEGGVIAPMAAVRSADVAFIVMLAGTALPGEQILEMQRALLSKLAGATDEQVKQQNDLIRHLIAVIKSEPDEQKAAAGMRAILHKEVPDQAAAQQLEQQVAPLRTPWFRYFLTYDPRPTLSRVRCPVLALIGEKDLQVPPKENLAEIERALRSGGNRHVTVQKMPQLNHLFQTSHTGSPSEYGQIEETMAPAALKLIGDWVLQQPAAPAAGPGHGPQGHR